MLFNSSSAYTYESNKRQGTLPIIDVHVHVHCIEKEWPWGSEFGGLQGAANLEEYLEKAYGLFRKYNVKAVVSSSPELVEKWKSHDEDDRIIPALLMFTPTSWDMTPERFESLVKSGKIKVFGEVAPNYTGVTLADPGWKPYLEVCEKYDVPVAVHTGSGAAGAHNTMFQKSRQRFGDPYLMEDVLVEHPKLRINLCHHGFEDQEHALQLMLLYPRVHADLAAMAFNSNAKRLAKEFLAKAKHDGVLDRVMFGSDLIMWPQHLELSLEYLDSLKFLTEKEKRDILYNNAVRFLKLKE